MNWIKRAWQGEEKLSKVFWTYLIAFNMIYRPVGLAVGFLLFLNCPIYSNSFNCDLLKYGTITFGCVTIVYDFWICVALWRCAFNSKEKFWGYVVRLIVIILIVNEFQMIVTICLDKLQLWK